MIGFYTENGKTHIEFRGNIVTIMADTIIFVKEIYKGLAEENEKMKEDGFVPQVYKDFVKEKLGSMAFADDVLDKEKLEELKDESLSDKIEGLKGMLDKLQEVIKEKESEE